MTSNFPIAFLSLAQAAEAVPVAEATHAVARANGPIEVMIELAYLVGAGLFILSLHWMGDPKTARRGVYAGVFGMAIAVLATWAKSDVTRHLWVIIPIALAVGPGVWLSHVPLTAVPQRTALSHAFGGLAAGLVGTPKYFYWYYNRPRSSRAFRMGAIVVEVLLGYLTFTGSLIAAAKLQEVKWIPQRPWVYKGQNVVNVIAFGVAVVLGVACSSSTRRRRSPWVFAALVFLALNFGWMLVMPIGGADMPTVIAILNAYAGLAAVAMGFVLDNKLLITAGALDGSSGLILSIIMCKAMNRSFTNVLFGAFGQVQAAKAGGEQKAVQARHAGERRGDPRAGVAGGDRAGLWHGGRAGPAQGAGAVRPAQEEGRDGEVRDPPRRGAHAGAHERAAGRGGGAVHRPCRDGRDQPRYAAVRRVPGAGRQRRGESGRSQRQIQPDLRHADHRRGQGQGRCSRSSGARARASRASTTSSTSWTRHGCSSATPRRWWAS